jgi:hypothetical protein
LSSLQRWRIVSASRTAATLKKRQRPLTGRGKNTTNQRVIGPGRTGAVENDRAPDGDIKNNAGSTREIGAVFQPEGGIFFRNLSRRMRSVRLMPQCSIAVRLFFRGMLP